MRNKRSLRERIYMFLIKLLCLAAVLAVAGIIIGRVTADYRSKMAEDTDRVAEGTAAPISLYNPPTEVPPETLRPGVTEEPTPEVTAVPTPTAEPVYDYLPIYRKAETTEKLIAITLDDMSQPAELERLVAAAREDVKLTLFPSGQALENQYVGKLVKKLVDEYGYEVENRGYSSKFLSRLSDEEMAKQIWDLQLAVDAALGDSYEMHFFRPYGGVGVQDQRTHSYLKQLGYRALVTWTVNGSATGKETLRDTLEPGNIYLFGTTNEDMTKLLSFIDAAVARGYRCVTLNELLGYPANDESGFDASYLFATVPPVEQTEHVTELITNGSSSRYVYLLQKRLEELGYLAEGSADGAYGSATSAAIADFQVRCGMMGTGVCNAEVQAALFAEDAPRAR